MSVPTYNPQVQLILRKTVRAHAGVEDRFGGGSAVIDLSPYLGEGSSITTQRGINQPAGSFSIRVGDRLYPALKQAPGAVDSLYALVEPMDVIEIRMRRTPGSGPTPLVMRGLVSDVRSDAAMSEDGKPMRTVTITGQDWGKWLQIVQIKYLRGQSIADLLSQMTGTLLETRYGIRYMVSEAGVFVNELITKVVNPFIVAASADASASLPPFVVDVSGADSGDMVSPINAQASPQGSLWTYLQQYGNLGPFYEAMIDDLESGPTLVYRKPPYLALGTQTPIFPDSSPTRFPVASEDVVSLSVSRSDADVANWYFVRAPHMDMQQPIDQILQSQTGAQLSLANYPNSAASIYGVRMMEVETQHGVLPKGEKAAVITPDQNALTGYTMRQIKYLQDSNQDNIAFEQGSIVFKGNEAVKPGTYFDLDRNGMVSDGYITSVTQTFEPFRSFKTSVRFIRGNGWANRSKMDASGNKNPYRALIGKGVYS